MERYSAWANEHFTERANEIEAKLPEWGRLIYSLLKHEAGGNAFQGWKSTPKDVARRLTVLVDQSLIAGAKKDEETAAKEAATQLLGLPWELLCDEKGYLFEGKSGVRVRRRLPNRDYREPAVTNPPIRVLLVSPRPEDDDALYIDHRISAKPVVEALAGLGELAEFKILTPPTAEALEEELRTAAETEKPYHVVHFDGHGVFSKEHGLGALCFEDPKDSKKLQKRATEIVDAEQLAASLRDHRVPLFFLEACQSAQTDKDPTHSVAGKLLQSGVASVAAMSHSVLVETAKRFVEKFYPELMQGRRVGETMLAGQRALFQDKFRGKTFTGDLHLEDWFVPVLFQEEQDPQLIRETPGEEVQRHIKKRRKAALGALPDTPPHTFIGRSRELLAAERLLEWERYVVLRGEGGEGKTTLGVELARWLTESRRFERAAFVCVEAGKDDDAVKALYALGTQLIAGYEAQGGTDHAEGLKLVERALGERETVIVFDNMESVLKPLGGAAETELFLPGKAGRARGPLPESAGGRTYAAGLHEPAADARAVCGEPHRDQPARSGRRGAAGGQGAGRGGERAATGRPGRERGRDQPPRRRRQLPRPEFGAAGGGGSGDWGEGRDRAAGRADGGAGRKAPG